MADMAGVRTAAPNRAPPAGRTVVRVLVAWVALLSLAIANGVLREAVLVPALGHALALPLSGVLLSGLVVAATTALLPWLEVCGPRRLLATGLAWLALTLVFEFGFGLLQGLPLETMLQAYSLRGGNLWPLVLAVIAIAPWLASRIRPGCRRGSGR